MKRILSKKLWLVAIFVSAIVYLSCTNGNKKPGQTSDADSTVSFYSPFLQALHIIFGIIYI